MSERPNPVLKAAEASSLPRHERARVGLTTDPVPEGKVLHAEPEHHFAVYPDPHDVEKAKGKTAYELGLPEGELNKLQHPGREHASADLSGTRGGVGKLREVKAPDSHHHHADFHPKHDKAHNKHLDSVYRGEHKK